MDLPAWLQYRAQLHPLGNSRTKNTLLLTQHHESTAPSQATPSSFPLSLHPVSEQISLRRVTQEQQGNCPSSSFCQCQEVQPQAEQHNHLLLPRSGIKFIKP